MNFLTINNFSKICRTCAREDEELISFHENVYLTEMLKLCAQIEFETNDELPKQICLSCIDELNKTYTFTIKCKMVDSALRNFIREHNMKNLRPETADNGEFSIFIKTEHSENSNDASTEPQSMNCTQCNEAFTSLSDLIGHQKLERHFCSKEMDVEEGTAKKKRKRKPRKIEAAPQSENINPMPASKRDRTFTCQICNKVMNNLSNFRRHELIHSGEKKFTCTVCNKNFRHSGTLITHQRSHSGERPCICDVCGKTYVDLSTLGRHKKIHTGERKFQCVVCNKRFTQSGDLNVHKRLHFEKPFSCDVCQKRFNRRSHLLKHGKVHLKNRNNSGGVVEILVSNEMGDSEIGDNEIPDMDESNEMSEIGEPCENPEMRGNVDETSEETYKLRGNEDLKENEETEKNEDE